MRDEEEKRRALLIVPGQWPRKATTPTGQPRRRLVPRRLLARQHLGDAGIGLSDPNVRGLEGQRRRKGEAQVVRVLGKPVTDTLVNGRPAMVHSFQRGPS